jgi:hypothetical protein
VEQARVAQTRAAELPPPRPTAEQRASRCAHAPDRASCADAELAVFELEQSCVVDLGPTGYRLRPATTAPALARITALGPAATPLLLRLAKARYAAARVAAAIGLGQVRSAEGRGALERLALDDSLATAMSGCVGRGVKVSDYARQSLQEP